MDKGQMLKAKVASASDKPKDAKAAGVLKALPLGAVSDGR